MQNSKLKTQKEKKESKSKAKVSKSEDKAKVEKKVVATKKTVKKQVKKAAASPTKAGKKSTKKETVKTPPKVKGKPKTMEELLAVTGYELKAPKRGQVIDGLITDITKRMVLVDIGGKTEGMVVDKEFDAVKDMISDMTVGDTIKVYVASPENDRGQILLSLKRAATDKKWENFDQYLKTEQTVSVHGLEVNRGGLIVQAEGIRGFVPSSQFGKEYLGNMESLVGQDFKAKVIEVDKEKNRLIFSERHVSEADAMAQKDEAIKQVKPNDTYKGVVSGIMPFGVFVTVDVPLGKGKKAEIGKVEGLIHISEISWEKVDDPNSYFKVGNALEVMVLSINEDSGKLNLSVKRLKDDPWSDIEKRYVVGNKVNGEVTRVAPFGVFVTLEPGVDGLIHISKVSSGEELKVGDKVGVYVESLNPENRRMSLGMVLTEVPVGYK
jgi:ribosomal protein S1